jgi:alpha-glucoside transport system permease protein
LAGFVIWPAGRVLVASVTDEGQYVGLRHFRAVFGEEGTWPVVTRTLLWGVVVPAVVAGLALGLAVASRREQTSRIAGVVLVLPMALPLVATATVFRLLYDHDATRGPVAGLTGVSFLEPHLITLALMSAFVWAWVGIAVAVFRTALDHRQPELADVVRLHQAARSDSWRPSFLDAEWRPVLRRTFAVVFALVALATTRSFDLILVMAPSSVLDEASVLSVKQWQTSGATTTGSGAALGVVWLVIVTAAVAVAAWWTRQRWPPPLLPAAGAGAGAGAGTDGVPRSRLWSVLRRTLLVAASLLWLFPLVVLAGTALHDRNAATLHGWWHRGLSLDSFRSAFDDGELTRSLLLTGALAVIVTAVVTALALMAAYALAWAPAKVPTVAGVVLLTAAVVPVQVIAGPINDLLVLLQLADTSIGLALVHIALGLPFAVLLLRNALSDIDRDTLIGAKRAGGSWLQVLWKVSPSAVATTVAVAALEFVQVWNDLVVGLLFGGPNAMPLGVLIHSGSRQFVSNSGPLSATAVIVALVPLVVVLAARHRIVSGLVSGALR